MQDGKIVGAVTHVLVNDPMRGYGIFIESMMDHKMGKNYREKIDIWKVNTYNMFCIRRTNCL